MVETRVKRGGQRLTARDQRSASPSSVAVALLVGGLALDHLLDNLLDVANLDEDVLGLEICVDDAAFSVQIVESQEHLFCYLLDQRHRNATVVPFLDETEQILAQYLKDHADVGAIGALVLKRVE